MMGAVKYYVYEARETCIVTVMGFLAIHNTKRGLRRRLLEDPKNSEMALQFFFFPAYLYLGYLFKKQNSFACLLVSWMFQRMESKHTFFLPIQRNLREAVSFRRKTTSSSFFFMFSYKSNEKHCVSN